MKNEIREQKMSDKSSRIITRRKNGTLRVSTRNLDASKTDESFAHDCDINVIVNRFISSNTQIPTPVGEYGDLSQIPKNLHEARMLLQASDELFMQLPAKARERFGNSPEAMFSWLENPQNHEEAVKLGLMTPRPLTPQNDNLNDESRRESTGSQKKPKTPPPPKNDDTE